MVYLAEIRDEMQQPILRLVQLPVIFRLHTLTGRRKEHRPLLIIVYTFSIFKISTVRIFQ